MKAQNIFLDENTGGKGRYFKSRFLQPGLVKYTFGVCVLDKATIDKFIQGFVGCPVIIGHKDVTNASAKDDRVGVISRIWYDETDGWFWGEGIIFDEKAISLVESGYNVSCQYDITEYSNNTTKALHNGNPYDKVILNGKPEHLAIVENPRYENAMIAVNAIDLTADNARGFGGDEGDWITVNGVHIFIKKGESKDEVVKDFIEKQSSDKKQSDKSGKQADKSDSKSVTEKREIEHKGAKVRINPDGKYSDIRIYAPEGKTFSNGDTWYSTQAETDKAEEHAKKIIDGEFGSSDKSDSKDGKDLYSDENFKYNAKRLNEQFGEKPYSEWQKDVQTMLKKYGKTEEDFDNAIGARKDAFKQSDTKEERIEARRKHQEVIRKHNQAYKDFEDGKISMEELDKADKELEKSNKEFYGTSDTKDKQSESKGEKATTSNIKQSRDEHGRVVLSKEGTNKKVKIHKNGNYFLASYGQELKDDDGYTEFQLFPSASGKSFKTEAGAIKWANKMLADNSIEPNIIIQAINEIKDNNMFRKLFNLKKEKTTMEKDKMKALFIDCIQDVLKAQNEEDIEDVEFEEDEEKAENKKCRNKKCKNEDVDKRKLIDEVAGIMKSAGCDDEVIRTAIAKMEKIGYDKSEAATADNGKKAKCEDEEDLEDAKNKAKNSIDELKGLLASAGVNKSASKYVTKAQAIELGNQLF